MARPIRSIEIYLPLDYNDGQPISPSKYIALQEELLRRFGGVTSVQRQFPLQGVWHSGQHVYHDRVVIFSVMDFSEATELERLRYLQRLKTRLKRKFDQFHCCGFISSLIVGFCLTARVIRRQIAFQLHRPRNCPREAR